MQMNMHTVQIGIKNNSTNKGNGVVSKTFNIYISLLIFSIINRSFVPFGIDFKYINLMLCCILWMFSVKRMLLVFDSNTKWVQLLYMLIFLSIFNQHIDIYDASVFKNVIILNLYNYVNICTLGIYVKYIDAIQVKKKLNFAMLFLTISMVLAACGVELPFNSYQSFSMLSNSGARYCGYGSDPNYVCVMAACLIIYCHAFEQDKKARKFEYLMGVLIIAMSRSQSVIVLIVLVSIISLFIERANLWSKKVALLFIFIALATIPVLLVLIRPLNSSVSMAIRYGMWERALNAASNHFFFGNGLMSARNNSYYKAHWFVQCHSTYFQILCEQGVFALFSYFVIFYKNVERNAYSALKYCFLIYFIWSFTYETMYLTYPILFFAIFPYCTDEKIKEDYNEKNSDINN